MRWEKRGRGFFCFFCFFSFFYVCCTCGSEEAIFLYEKNRWLCYKCGSEVENARRFIKKNAIHSPLKEVFEYILDGDGSDEKEDRMIAIKEKIDEFYKILMHNHLCF